MPFCCVVGVGDVKCDVVVMDVRGGDGVDVYADVVVVYGSVLVLMCC